MPNFTNPFSGNKSKDPLSKDELIRALRFFISAEYEAVQIYTQISEICEDESIKKVINDIANEELVHAGEFLTALESIAPNEMKFYYKGVQEAEKLMGRKSLSDAIKSLVKSIKE